MVSGVSPVNNFDSGDFDHSMAQLGIKTGRLRVDDYLAHH
jgi:hypothetical protein